MTDVEKLKKIASVLLSNLRGVDFDLAVYQAAFHSIAGTPTPSAMQALLEDVRQNVELRKLILDKYEPIRKGLERFGQSDSDKALLEILRAWKPQSREN